MIENRSLACEKWEEDGLLFPSEIGTPVEEHRVLRRFQTVCEANRLLKLRVYDSQAHLRLAFSGAGRRRVQYPRVTPMGRGSRIGKERKRAEVAKALVAGELPSQIAAKLGCSTAYVGELAAERETQNLAQRSLSPHHARLAKATELREREQLRDELNDFAPAMKGVERLCDLLEQAQGGKRESGAAAGGLTLITVAQVLQLISSEAGAR